MSKILIKLPEVKQITSFSKSSIYSMVKAGTFPAPIRIGLRRVAWDKAAIDNWITSCPSAANDSEV